MQLSTRSSSNQGFELTRDTHGDVLASQTLIHLHVSSAFTVGALTCLWADKIGLELRIIEVVIEGDSLTIIKKCINNNQDKLELCAYIQDIKHHSSNFLSLRFQHAYREANRLAHSLAFDVLRNGEEIYLKGSVLAFATRMVEMELPREPY